VNIVVLLLAIACVVLGTLLFKKREQLRFRGDKMAATINKVAKMMDEGNEHQYAKKLLLEKKELNIKKDANAEENKKITLHLTNADNVGIVLAPFEKQVDDIVGQRNELSETLNKISETLKIPETYGAAVFKSVASYREKKTNLLTMVEKVNARDEATVDQIVSSSGVLGFSVDRGALKNINDFRTPLNEFGTKVEAFKKRLDTYASCIGKVCGILEVGAPSLQGEDYASEISGVETKVRGYKETFEQTKRDLADTKGKLEDTQQQLKNAITKHAEFEKNIEELKKQIVEYKKIIEWDGTDPNKPPQQEDFIQKLVGKILEVNDRWGFVVMDLSKNNKMTIGPKKKEIFIPLPEGMTMTVARGDKPIAEIKVVKVNESCSIANIIPGKKYATIQPGDKVFFANEQGPAQKNGQEKEVQQ
jgi:DNA repair exonuclease SbcCD ATPase subunit